MGNRSHPTCISAGGILNKIDDVQQVELMTIAEGHTSSIVRVTIRRRGWETPIVFSLTPCDMTSAVMKLSEHADLKEWQRWIQIA
jgi:hypothetical protein